MSTRRQFSIPALVLLLLSGIAPAPAVESTMPSNFREIINPALASRYSYIEGGDLEQICGLPTYQWMPANNAPAAIILGIHGLTLHGRRYRVLARAMAINGIGFVAPDMIGFGKNRFDPQWQKDANGKPRTRAHHEESYQAIAKLAAELRRRYPTIPIIAMGESLGCTFCVRLGAENSTAITGMILSAPAVKVNPSMYASPGEIEAGLKAVLAPHHMVNLKGFFTELVSGRVEVVNEMLDDPYIVKELSIGELLSTDEFVEKTVHWGKTMATNMPILIIQGSADKCVVPRHVTDLMMAMPSEDQRVSWRGSFGHLQLETAFMRASIIDAVGDWLHDHGKENRAKLEILEQNVADLGGTLVR